jgi:hypothetical protein
LTAYKAVMGATHGAGGCRNRGDSAGTVSIVVEFGTDGHVQRANAKGKFVNPGTTQCIVSKFSSLSIPNAPSAPLIITTDFALH